VGEGTGIAGVDSVVAWSVAIAAILGLLGLMTRLVSKIYKAIDEAREIWRGHPGSPGIPPRPGIAERIGSAEQRGHRTEERVEAVEKRQDGVELRVDGLERNVGRLLLGGEGGQEGLLGSPRRVG
jgi:hypothetical protein